MYKYVQMPTQVLKQTHKTHKTHTHQPAAILVFVPTQVCSVKGQALDQRREEEKDEEKEEKRRIQDNLHASFLRK